MAYDPTTGGIPLGLDYNPAPTPAPASGNSYLQQQRAWIGNEFEQKPWLRRYVGGVISHEQGSPAERAKVFEAMANRLNYIHTMPGYQNLSVEDYLKGKGPGGQFYNPIQKGQINENFIRGTYDRERPAMDAAMNTVLGGSNELKGYTDQGSQGDPNWHKGTYIDSPLVNGKSVRGVSESYGDWTGSGATKWRMAQQQQVAGAPTQVAQNASPANAAAVAGGGQETAPTVPALTPPPGSQIAQAQSLPGTPASDQQVPQQQQAQVAQAAPFQPNIDLAPPTLGMQQPNIPFYMRHTNPQLAYQRLSQMLPQGFTGFQGA